MTSEWLVYYAAVVSTGTLLWNMKVATRDKGKLSLLAQVACKPAPAEGKQTTTYWSLSNSSIGKMPDGEHFLDVRITNIGRRPITLETWETLSLMTDGSFTRKSAVTLKGPITLEESQAYSMIVTDFDTLRGGVGGLAVVDSHGKRWCLPKKQFVHLKETMLENHL
jgi:hypothetical protein